MFEHPLGAFKFSVHPKPDTKSFLSHPLSKIGYCIFLLFFVSALLSTVLLPFTFLFVFLTHPEFILFRKMFGGPPVILSASVLMIFTGVAIRIVQYRIKSKQYAPRAEAD